MLLNTELDTAVTNDFFDAAELTIAPNSLATTAATSLSLPVYCKSVLDTFKSFVLVTFELSASASTTANLTEGRAFF